MRKLLKKMFWPEPDPLDLDQIPSAPPPAEKEEQMKEVLQTTTEAVIRALNHSRAIRTRLAEETLHAVSGDFK